VILTLRAWSTLSVELPARIAEEVKKSKLVDVRLGTAPGHWELVSESSVGVVVGSDWELRVEPKIEIPQLLFLVAYAHSQDGWRDIMAGFGREDQLLDVVASGFAIHCERAIERGLLRGYVHCEESRPDLRGRIRFAHQIARNPGLPLPLELSYDDFTADVRENRLMRTALEVLLRLPRIPTRAREKLLGVRAALGDVAILRDRRDFVAPAITRLNNRYEAALVLAELILRHSSVTASSGEVSSATFVFDMNRVFEDFVGAALTEAFRPVGGEIRLQHPDRLDSDLRVALPIKPDITWWRRTQCLAVIDAKYKSILDRTMPNADAYQMLAYCIALDRLRGFVVYAKDYGERQRQHTIRHSGHVIDVRVLDVGLEPRDLLRQVDALAADIAQSAGVAWGRSPAIYPSGPSTQSIAAAPDGIIG
jgi:5-methylcytosine-specific restriction enzyme subunit McrC